MALGAGLAELAGGLLFVAGLLAVIVASSVGRFEAPRHTGRTTPTSV